MLIRRWIAKAIEIRRVNGNGIEALKDCNASYFIPQLMKFCSITRINFSAEIEFLVYTNLNYLDILDNENSIFIVKNRVKRPLNKLVPREERGEALCRPLNYHPPINFI